MTLQRLIPSRNVIFLAMPVALIVLAWWWSAVALKERKLTIAIHNGVEGVALRELAAMFSKKENITVEVIDWPYDQLFEKVSKNLGENESDVPDPHYDVLMIDDPWFPALNSKKPGFQKLLDSEGSESKSKASDQPLFKKGEIDLEDFVKPTLRVCQDPYATGAYYALPFVGNSQLFCYLESDFGDPDKVPTTWDGVLAESERITKDPTRTHGYIMRVGKGNSIVTDFMPILWAEDKTNPCPLELYPLDTEGAKRAFKFLVDLGKKGKADFSIVASDDFDLALHLKRKNASMCIVWSAWAMAIAKASQSEPEAQVATAMVSQPQVQGKAKIARVPGPNPLSKGVGKLAYSKMPGAQPMLGAWLLAVSAKSDHMEEAKMFLRFATSKLGLTEAAKAGNPPPRISLLKDLQSSYPSFAKQYESLCRSRPRPRTPYWREFEKEMGECLSDLYANAIDVDVAVKRVNAVIETLRKEEKGPPNCFQLTSTATTGERKDCPD